MPSLHLYRVPLFFFLHLLDSVHFLTLCPFLPIPYTPFLCPLHVLCRAVPLFASHLTPSCSAVPCRAPLGQEGASHVLSQSTIGTWRWRGKKVHANLHTRTRAPTCSYGARQSTLPIYDWHVKVKTESINKKIKHLWKSLRVHIAWLAISLFNAAILDKNNLVFFIFESCVTLMQARPV